MLNHAEEFYDQTLELSSGMIPILPIIPLIILPAIQVYLNTAHDLNVVRVLKETHD